MNNTKEKYKKYATIFKEMSNEELGKVVGQIAENTAMINEQAPIIMGGTAKQIAKNQWNLGRRILAVKKYRSGKSLNKALTELNELLSSVKSDFLAPQVDLEERTITLGFKKDSDERIALQVRTSLY